MSDKAVMAQATLESSRPARMLEGHDVAYAMRRLGCSMSNLYRLIASGQLRAVDVAARAVDDARYVRKTPTRIRPLYRFFDEDIDAFLASRRVDRTPEAGTPEAVASAAAKAPLTLVGKDRYR